MQVVVSFVPGEEGDFEGDMIVTDEDGTRTVVSFVIAFSHLRCSHVCICVLSLGPFRRTIRRVPYVWQRRVDGRTFGVR